ncbi:MAG: hypothetical protein JST89_17555 [Cyanobacteria bacterium SZAS-4]|nr:hypothetical protein [Cyanobacteria bacterium SZAS-4]
MKYLSVAQLAVTSALLAVGAVIRPALADKNPGGSFFGPGGSMPAPAGRSYMRPWLYNGRPIGTPGGTPPDSNAWSNANPSGSLVVPGNTVMAFPASPSYVWNAATHPIPLNPAAPKNLELGTWTIKDKSKNTIVGTWMWNATNQNFSGSYTNGVVDTLRVDEFTGRKIAISGYNSAGLPVDFIGTRTSPNTAEGTATAHMPTGPFTWTFQASW